MLFQPWRGKQLKEILRKENLQIVFLNEQKLFQIFAIATNLTNLKQPLLALVAQN